MLLYVVVIHDLLLSTHYVAGYYSSHMHVYMDNNKITIILLFYIIMSSRAHDNTVYYNIIILQSR